MYGRFPDAELWRINIAYVMLAGSLIALMIPGFKWKGWVSLFLLVIYPIISFYLFLGGSFGLEHVDTPLWGGLFLTLVISIVGIVGLALLLLRPMKGMVIGLQWALRMHGFGGHRD